MYKIDLTWVGKDLKKLCKRHHNLRETFRKLCKELETNPKYGDLMGGLPIDLHGKIRRCRILGRRGFRFIYSWEEGTDTIRSLFLFPRSKDYHFIDWKKVSRRLSI